MLITTPIILFHCAIIDIDECEANQHNCTQLCNNIDGSYFCDCVAGYSLDSDNITCNGT